LIVKNYVVEDYLKDCLLQVTRTTSLGDRFDYPSQSTCNLVTLVA